MSSNANARAGQDVRLFTMPSLDVAKKKEKSEPKIDTDEIERKAYEKGYEQGEKAGFSMGEQKALVLLQRLETIIREISELKESIVREIEPQFVELAIVMAHKIILSELSLRPEVIVEMTSEALRRIERTGQITIKINPSLHDLFQKHRPDLLNIHPDIVFDIDPSASPQGPVVIGQVEDILTDVDLQMKTMLTEMGERLASR